MSAAKRLVLTLAGRRAEQGSSPAAASSAGSSTRLVDRGGSMPAGSGAAGGSAGSDLEEIAIVSNASGGQVKYGSGNLSSNGPRLVPGIITSGGARMGGAADHGSPVAQHKSSVESVPGLAGLGGGGYGGLGRPYAGPHGPHPQARSVSRQSLLDLVGSRLGVGRNQRPHQRYFSSSRDSLAASYVNRTATASELDLSRKARRRELRGRLKLPAAVTSMTGSGLGDSRAGMGGHGPGPMGSGTALLPRGSVAHGSAGYGGVQHRGRGSTSVARGPGRPHPGPSWSFVFDPAGRLCYYWSMVVSLAFLYNFWVIIYRFAFQEINRESIVVWFCLDYLADFLYVADIVFHFRTGYLEDGVLQTDAGKLRQHYMNSTTFYIDCLCLLPLDFLYLSIGFNSVLRGFRLVKIYRFWAFMDRTERHTNYPNLFRSTSLIHYLLVIFHWNGCLYHIVYKNNGFGSKNWVFGDHDSGDVVKQYLQSYYWCTLALTTIGDLPRPRSKSEYMFVIGQLMFGLLLFATVLGHVANIVTSVSTARKEFQAKLDGVKTYMRMRRVPGSLQVKVIKWFDYLWLTQKCSDEERAVSCLPDKLKAEIAINVHLDTLKRVEIFQNTEAGFLCELVLRLRPVLFSPGDYICRKGEVGKEMYIVNRGRLQVVADNGNTVLATLKAGSYFGEISILNMGTAGNRRTASVRSVGYSDLFVLSKKDMWDVLKEYPAARVRLEAIAVKRLEKYKRAPLEKAALGRSQSTPGLVESRGRVPLEEMWVSPLDPPAAMFSPSHSPTARLMSRPPLAKGAVPATLAGPGPAGFAGGRSLPPHLRNVDSPSSANSSQPSSEPVSHMSHLAAPAYAPPGTTASCNSMVQSRAESRLGSRSGSLVPMHATPLSLPLLHHQQGQMGVLLQVQDDTQDALRAKIQALQEQLARVQTENASLSAKLSQQRWEVDQRLMDIEMHICGASSGNSSAADDRESFI